MKCEHDWKDGIAIDNLWTNGKFVDTLSECHNTDAIARGEGLWRTREFWMTVKVSKCIHCGQSKG